MAHLLRLSNYMNKLSTTIIVAIMLFASSCGSTTHDNDEKIRQARAVSAQKDSLALKIGVTPTMDCLPFYVASHTGIFDSLGVDVSLKAMNSQIDIDEAMTSGKLECMVSDLMRTERLKRLGIPLEYISSTNLYWQMIGNRKGRILEIKHLGDKMVAMSRYSGTDYLSTLGIDSVKPDNPVFRIQVNDVGVRLMMMLNNEMDAVMLPEPQASAARAVGNHVLMDSRHKDIRLGVIAIHSRRTSDSRRQEQLKKMRQAYDQACDSINTRGLSHYSRLIKECCHVDDGALKSLPKITFEHMTPPREKDIARTRNVRWRTS